MLDTHTHPYIHTHAYVHTQKKTCTGTGATDLSSTCAASNLDSVSSAQAHVLNCQYKNDVSSTIYVGLQRATSPRHTGADTHTPNREPAMRERQ